ncbi:MAG: hypothetical protein PHU25_19020, partial [Deltaproteobacteria bacterium]|nr:hypothetical protein [Deltaproteobacteria bacterium]
SADAILANAIANGAVTTNEILDNTITTADISNTVKRGACSSICNDANNTYIESNSISISENNVVSVATNGVTTNEIANGTITNADISADAILANAIANGAVTTNEIANGTITNADISADAILANAIANGAVTTNEILDGTILNNDIAADTILANAIANGAVTTNEILDSTITAADISNTVKAGACSSICNDANNIYKESDSISIAANNAISVATNGVTTNEILDNTITTADIANNTIVWDDVNTSGGIQHTLTASCGDGYAIASIAANGSITRCEYDDNADGCTDCLDEQEIKDIYLLNTGDTGAGQYTFNTGSVSPGVNITSTSFANNMGSTLRVASDTYWTANGTNSARAIYSQMGDYAATGVTASGDVAAIYAYMEGNNNERTGNISGVVGSVFSDSDPPGALNGVWGSASNGDCNDYASSATRGGYFQASATCAAPAYGVVALADQIGYQNSYGLYAKATAPSGYVAYGVYAEANADTAWGLYTPNNAYVGGNLTVAGSIVFSNPRTWYVHLGPPNVKIAAHAYGYNVTTSGNSSTTGFPASIAGGSFLMPAPVIPTGASITGAFCRVNDSSTSDSIAIQMYNDSSVIGTSATSNNGGLQNLNITGLNSVVTSDGRGTPIAVNFTTGASPTLAIYWCWVSYTVSTL